MSPPRLSSERVGIISQAFGEWYDNQDSKQTAMQGLGYSPTLAYAWRNGLRTPPPTVLCELYRQTEDTRFLLTQEEKALYKRQPLPDPTVWPELEEAFSSGELIRLSERISSLAMDINKLAALAPEDPVRKRARSKLVGPCMALYRATTVLNIQFPAAFRDLLQQLDVATTLFAQPTGKKK